LPARPSDRAALGIMSHTGWAACVVVSGTLKKPAIIANARIEILPDAERFCFHRASEMPLVVARNWLPRIEAQAIANAKTALRPLLALNVTCCAVVAKEGSATVELHEVLASHPQIHRAEGAFYRDIVLRACTVPVQLVSPASLNANEVGKLAQPPWGRDQKLAALAAWSMIDA
jgi:hypothetical protein